MHFRKKILKYTASQYRIMKGLSPLVATVLLVAFTVTLATIISGWFTTVTESTASTVSNKTEIATRCSSASLSIDDVYSGTGANITARAAVRNSGSAGLTIKSAQLFNSAGFNFTAANLPVSLERGEAATIEFFYVNITSCPASFSRLIVSSDCGNAGAVFDASPKCI